MISLTVSVLLASLLCLSFSSSRMAGILGIALLIFWHTAIAAALLVLGGAIYLIHYKKRSLKNAIRKLHDRSAR